MKQFYSTLAIFSFFMLLQSGCASKEVEVKKELEPKKDVNQTTKVKDPLEASYLYLEKKIDNNVVHTKIDLYNPDIAFDIHSIEKEKVLSKKVEIFLLQYWKARQAFRKKQYKESLKHLAIAQEALPGISILYQLKGSVYYRQGKLQQAREMWEKALVLDPDSQDVREKLQQLAKSEEKSQ